MLRWLILVLVLSVARPAWAAPDAAAAAAVARAVTAGFVRPGYAAFRRSADALAAATGALCDTPSQSGLTAARQAFAAAALAWSRIEIVRFGPVTAENRLERLLFWPDRKGIGLRQVQAILAAKDPAAADARSLAGKSVAAQGFGALEYVLYGAGAETLASGADPYRCAYARAISGNIGSIAGQLDAAWADPEGIAARWASPGLENLSYRNADETLGEALDTLIHGLELVRDVRLAFLGDKVDDDRPKSALFWRSGLTVAALDANLGALRDALAVSGLAALPPAEFAWIVPSAEFEFANAADALQGVDAPIAEILADPRKRGRLVYAKLVTSSLSDIIGTRLGGALGVTAGFSSLDGD